MRRTPKEKKRLSYAKDRRNTYGENSKSSRKNIRRSRATKRRKVRRLLRSALRETDLGVEEPAPAAKVRKSGWRKSPYTPLGEALRKQRTRRAARSGRKAARRKRGP